MNRKRPKNFKDMRCRSRKKPNGNPKSSSKRKWGKEEKPAHIVEAEKWGREAERRFLRAWNEEPSSYPDWLRSVTKSTHEEDGKGVDFWMNDVRGGRISVQIKGSMRGILRHYEKHGVPAGILLVITSEFDSEKIRQETLKLLALRKLPSWKYQA